MPEVAPAAPAASPAPSATPAPSAPTTSAPAGNAPNTATAAKAALPHQGAAVAGNDHPAAEPGETKAETVARTKLKLKVSGKEIEREFAPEELQLYVQKGMGADEKFQEAAQVRKTFQSFMEAVKTNPFEAFKDPAFGDLGKNFRDLVIQNLAQEFEAEDMKKANPQQFELKQLQQRVAAFEAREQAAQAEAQARAQKESDARMWAETQKTWTAALDKSGLGQNPGFVRQMAEIGRDFLDAGLDLSPDLLVAELKNRLADQQRTFLSGAKGEQLINLLGADVVNEILAFKVAQVQKGRVPQDPIKPPVPGAADKSSGNELENMKGSSALRTYRDFLHGK